MRQREHGGDDEPQGVLRAPHLVEDEEQANDQAHQLRDARGLRRLQAQDEHAEAAQQEQDQRYGIEDHRGTLA